MSIEDLNEIGIMLDQTTILYFKLQQINNNKPRPENYYELWEELNKHYENSKDLLIETMISKNLPIVLKKTQPPTQ